MNATTPIKLGEGYYQTALLVQTNNTDRLVLYQVADMGEHCYTPAASMEVYGKQALVAIRDALNLAFPPGV